MKITISIDDILDGIYAESALTTMAVEADGRTTALTLTPDHRDALKRMARDALAATTALTGRQWPIAQIDESHFTVTPPDDLTLDNSSITLSLSVAIKHVMIYLIYRMNDHNTHADTYLDIARSIMKNISTRTHRPARITPD